MTLNGLALGQNKETNMDRIRVLNVEIDNVSMEELLAQLKRGGAGDTERGPDGEDVAGQGIL